MFLNTNIKTSQHGRDVSFYLFLHHQGEDAEIVVGLAIEIPVVAVQASLVEVAEVEAVAVRVAGYTRYLP